MEDSLMVTVFHVYYPYLKTEIYLLDDWLVAEDEKYPSGSKPWQLKGLGTEK